MLCKKASGKTIGFEEAAITICSDIYNQTQVKCGNVKVTGCFAKARETQGQTKLP